MLQDAGSVDMIPLPLRLSSRSFVDELPNDGSELKLLLLMSSCAKFVRVAHRVLSVLDGTKLLPANVIAVNVRYRDDKDRGSVPLRPHELTSKRTRLVRDDHVDGSAPLKLLVPSVSVVRSGT